MKKRAFGAFVLSWVALGLLTTHVDSSTPSQDGRRSGVCMDRHADPDTVNDSSAAPGDPDWSSAIWDPCCWHQVQHFEWLGAIVDEESTKPGFDTKDNRCDEDGLLMGTLSGGFVDLTVEVSTNYVAHPTEFPAGSSLHVDAWIDWDNDDEFEHPSEFVGTWSGGPPFEGGQENTTITISGPTFGNRPGNYDVRLRLDYHNPGSPHVPSPEGNADGVGDLGNSYGETEDFDSIALMSPFAAPAMGSVGLVFAFGALLVAGVSILRR